MAKYTAVGQQSLVFSVIMLAGFIQILLGWLRLGSYIQLVPRPVTSGEANTRLCRPTAVYFAAMPCTIASNPSKKPLPVAFAGFMTGIGCAEHHLQTDNP